DLLAEPSCHCLCAMPSLKVFRCSRRRRSTWMKCSLVILRREDAEGSQNARLEILRRLRGSDDVWSSFRRGNLILLDLPVGQDERRQIEGLLWEANAIAPQRHSAAQRLR